MRRHTWSITLLAVAAMACTVRDTDTDGEPVVATPTFGALGVPIGVALLDRAAASTPQWCADFDEQAIAAGDTVTLVWPDSSADAASTALALVRRARPGRCSQLPGDTTNLDDPDLGTVYELALVNPVDSTTVGELAATPAIAVRGNAPWTRGPDAFVRADLDGDENPEQARLCTSSEGIHLTLWTLVDSTAAGKPRAHRRWRAYQSLGYDVEPSCTERETDDPPATEGSSGH
jgi:hypothetical protein